MKELILFADYGLDDAAATVSIFNRAARFDRIYILPIGGNVPVGVSYRNCFTLLSHFPDILSKITVVDTRHIDQPSEYLADIHGQDGMGDLFVPTEPAEPVATIPFEAFLESLTGAETVLSLGPMTLVRPLMERHAHPLVIMGGCMDTPPNFKGYEFNHYLDKEAFSYCAPKARAVITLDTCRTDRLNIRNMEVTGEDIHSDILKTDLALSFTRGEDGCYAWDDVAAAYVLFPERFTVEIQTDPYGNTYAHARYISEKIYYEE